jgi:excisionase family DNA binding protein
MNKKAIGNIEGDTSPSKWMSVSQASKELGVHPNTVYRWARGGEIDAVRVKSGWRFKVEVIRELKEFRQLYEL